MCVSDVNLRLRNHESQTQNLYFRNLFYIVTFRHCPKTTPQILVVKKTYFWTNLSKIWISDLWRRSRIHESHSFENRKISQTFKILKYQQNLITTNKKISFKKEKTLCLKNNLYKNEWIRTFFMRNFSKIWIFLTKSKIDFIGKSRFSDLKLKSQTSDAKFPKSLMSQTSDAKW